MKIGCHLSSSGGYMAMGQTAVSIGANVFQFFTRNPRGGAAKPIDKADVAAFNEYAAANGIGPILAHAPYTLNAAGAEERVREFAEMTMADDLKRLELTPGALYNFHPGSHVGQGAEKGIELIAGMLKRIFSGFGSAPSTTVLLETMAGKGSEIGRNFAELRAIMDLSGLDLGVCLDTCHVWDGGYDIVGDLDGVLDEFDRVIGFKYLRGMHLNDAMKILGSHVDRHSPLGEGMLGIDTFRFICEDPRFDNVPLILETPDESRWSEEIAQLKSFAGV